MKKLILLALAVSAPAFAQTPPAQTSPSTNPNDLSRYQDIARGQNLPSIQAVANTKARAEALLAQGNCAQALPVLEAWATQANWLSNLLAAGLEPFYRAPSDERRAVPRARLDQLIPVENAANNYRADRNRAMIARADCLVRLNRPNEAAAVYARALDLIPASDTAAWDQALKGLYTLIGVRWP